MGDKKIDIGANENCHTEDNSPKYRMVGKMISTLRSFACAQDDVKFARHPELGATHVDTCVNVGDICNDYLKSFSVSINVDNRLRNKCAIVCVGKNYPLSWEREQAFE